VFDEAQYDRDVANGLITGTRTTTNVNRRPYLPNELKAAHGAANLNVTRGVGKKKVVIATTIAHNWPPAYIQKCFEAFCTVYGIKQTDGTFPTMEVINLGPRPEGADYFDNPPRATTEQGLVNAYLTNQIGAYVNTTGINVSSVSNLTTATRGDVFAIPNFVPNIPFTEEDENKLGWLEELILNFWAIAMNPNAHFRIINSHSASNLGLPGAVIYASTDANFSSDPASPNYNQYGTTDYVNMSWGDMFPGSDRKEYDDDIFINPNICYFSAAGNYRWAGYPATSSNVMCVGGASLYHDVESAINPPANPKVELWVGPTDSNSSYESQGGGCGFSYNSEATASRGAYFRPRYQVNGGKGLEILRTAQYNIDRRACPDMCSLADPVTGLTIFCANAEGTKISKKVIGGTSLASPMLCGLFSQLSQRRYNQDMPPLTTRLTIAPNSATITTNNLHDFLYANFQTEQLGTMFYDIVTGTTVLHNSTDLGPNSGATYATSSGYDIATGLGFPQMQQIMDVMFRTTIATPPPPPVITLPPVNPTPVPPVNPTPVPPGSTPPAPTPPAPTPPAPTPPAPPAPTSPAPANPPVVNEITTTLGGTGTRTKIIYNINN
jgi:hypothetical protein